MTVLLTLPCSLRTGTASTIFTCTLAMSCPPKKRRASQLPTWLRESTPNRISTKATTTSSCTWATPALAKVRDTYPSKGYYIPARAATAPMARKKDSKPTPTDRFRRL
ncbi:unnamed protein product [Ectocarpus fasciculatus]